MHTTPRSLPSYSQLIVTPAYLLLQRRAGVEDLSDGSRDHALHLVIAAALHGVRLARARLAVGEHADVVAVQRRLWDGQTRG